MNRSFVAKLLNDKAVKRKLGQISEKAFKRVNKKVLRAGAAPMVRAVKTAMPTDTGAAKKAIVSKITNASAVVGVNANATGPDGRRPANYIHLIEFGHVTEDGSIVPGSHPIERGAAHAEPASAAAMTSKAEVEINKEIARAK